MWLDGKTLCTFTITLQRLTHTYVQNKWEFVKTSVSEIPLVCMFKATCMVGSLAGVAAS
jgi:hypothetical protein